MTKTESESLPGGKSELSGEEELLIRPFKKLKVSRLLRTEEVCPVSPPRRGAPLKPSRLSSSAVQSHEEDPRRRNPKDFSSLIIRRFDTISLSGCKRKKKLLTGREQESPSAGSGEEEEEDRPSLSSVNCAAQARQTYNDVSVDDLAGYLENSMVFPKKMSYMAEMMYT